MNTNRMKTRISIKICIFTLLTFATSANTWASNPLKWQDLQDIALSKNPDLKSAESTLRASRADLKSAYGAFLPSVTASASRTGTESNLEVSSALFRTKRKTEDLSLTASLNVFNGFSTLGTVQKAGAARDQAEANKNEQSAEVRNQLRIAYFNLYIQQERIKLFEKIVKREEQNQKLVGLKYENGSEARWNVHKTKADYNQSAFNLEAAKVDLNNAKTELARILNQENIGDIFVETPEENLFSQQKITATELLKSNPTVQKLQHEEIKSNKDILIARAAFLPSIDLSYSKSRDHWKNTAADTKGETWAITAKWNIFNGLSDFHRVQKASAANEVAQYNLESAQNNLRQNLQNKGDTLRIAAAKIPLYVDSRVAAEERLNTVSAQYRSGLKTYLDWEQAESQLIKAEQEEIQAKKEAYYALAEFEKILGKTLEEP